MQKWNVLQAKICPMERIELWAHLRTSNGVESLALGG